MLCIIDDLGQIYHLESFWHKTPDEKMMIIGNNRNPGVMVAKV